MVFQIPSLSQSRQKQDELLSQQSSSSPLTPSLVHKTNVENETSNGSGTKRKRIVSSSPSSQSQSAPVAAVRQHSNINNNSSISANAPTIQRRALLGNSTTTKKTRTAVVNPYAKRKSQHAAHTITTNNSSSSSSTRNATATTNTTTTDKERISGRPKMPSHSPRQVVDARNTSFSQAFDTVEETCHYDTELTNLRESTSNKETIQDISTTALNDLEKSTMIPSTTITAEEINSRDQRHLLQSHVLHISTRQRANPILQLLRNVPYTFSKITPDYIISPNRAALFLSIRYHNLHPNYVHTRIAELQSDFDLRVLLCLVDVEDNASTLLFLNKLCVVNNVTLLLAWSEKEVARYLETLKAYESKDASSIQKRKKTTITEQMADVLSCVRSVNKTDAAQLMMQFETLGGVCKADVGELGRCPGIGDKKVRRLWEAFHTPFSSACVARNRREREEAEMVVVRGKKEVSGGGGDDTTNNVTNEDDDDDYTNGDYAVEVVAINDLGDNAPNINAYDNTRSSSSMRVGAIAEV